MSIAGLRNGGFFYFKRKIAACCPLASAPVSFRFNEKLQQAISDYFFFFKDGLKTV